MRASDETQDRLDKKKKNQTLQNVNSVAQPRVQQCPHAAALRRLEKKIKLGEVKNSRVKS